MNIHNKGGYNEWTYCGSHKIGLTITKRVLIITVKYPFTFEMHSLIDLMVLSVLDHF